MGISENLSKNVMIALDSVENLLDQCLQAWQESRAIDFSDEYFQIENLVICGMGGSSLPAYMIKSVFPSRIPISITESYDLPSWAGPKTLVSLSSYSGNTEETLSCAQQAKSQGCLITGVTSGGQLKEFLRIGGYPFYSFKPKYNPSGLPRFGIGYGVFGQLGILNKLRIVNKVGGSDWDKHINDGIEHLRVCKDEMKASATKLAKDVKEKILVIFAADHLEGNGQTFTNQVNETAKTLAFWVRLPGADHSLIEGFKRFQAPVVAIFIESKHYSARMRERFRLTREVIKKDGYSTYVYEVQEGTLIQEMLEALFFSSFFSVQLSIENGDDPLAIPSVDFIKSKLSLMG